MTDLPASGWWRPWARSRDVVDFGYRWYGSSAFKRDRVGDLLGSTDNRSATLAPAYAQGDLATLLRHCVRAAAKADARAMRAVAVQSVMLGSQTQAVSIAGGAGASPSRGSAGSF
jgi:hypothetical protein